MTTPGLASIRIDVWLWAVRQVKTRSLATAAVRGGHVRINDETVKAATKVKIGDTVRYRVQGFDRVLRVEGIVAKRVSAPVAQTCYTDLTPERANTWVPLPGKRERGAGRPTKKERRALDALRGRDSSVRI